MALALTSQKGESVMEGWIFFFLPLALLAIGIYLSH
jgi:hypothetical protein